MRTGQRCRLLPYKTALPFSAEGFQGQDTPEKIYKPAKSNLSAADPLYFLHRFPANEESPHPLLHKGFQTILPAHLFAAKRFPQGLPFSLPGQYPVCHNTPE